MEKEIDFATLEYETYKNENESVRLDVFLKANNESISRNYIQDLIKEGYVFVNNKSITKPSYKLEINEEVTIYFKEVEELEIKPENIPLDIVYEDDDIVVINKPVDMVCHPSCGHYTNTLVNAILYHCKSLSGINGVIRPGIVHRLDKDTSGLLVVAKNDNAHQYLKDQLTDHSMSRVYYAIVKGVLDHKKGLIQTLIGRDEKNRLKQAVLLKNGKEAITEFEVIESFNNASLVKVNLKTGRTHQIRVHMDFIKHPILNDPLYGINNHIDIKCAQLLHAKELTLRHPKTHELMHFECDLPLHFKEALAYIKGK